MGVRNRDQENQRKELEFELKDEFDHLVAITSKPLSFNFNEYEAELQFGGMDQNEEAN